MVPAQFLAFAWISGRLILHRIICQFANLTERCIGMTNMSNFKGIALVDTVLSHLKSLNLPLEKMIGQGYDGANYTSGKEKGVQAIAKEPFPIDVYVHCLAHALNLVFVKSCAIPEIHSSFDLIWDIASFLNQAEKEMHD